MAHQVPALRAVIYARVSQDRSRQQRSVSEQLTECRAVCERNGWTVVTELSDNDRSASRYAKKSRPAFAKLLSAIAAGDVDVVVLWEASRSSRDLETFLPLRALLRDTETKLSYNGRVLDLDDPDDAFNATLDALLAERESGVTRKRVLRAVKANATSGRPHGRVLYGYKRVFDATTGRAQQTPDEVTGSVVLEVFERFAAGESRRSIMLDLNRRGVPSPRGADQWSDVGQLTRILRNPGYVAQRVHQGKVVGDGSWPALIDQGLWARCQTRLDGIPVRTRPTGYKHLLTGLAVCGVPAGDGICGERLGSIRTHASRGEGFALLCPRFHLSRKEAPVDAHVTAVLLRRLERLDVRRLLANAAQSNDELRKVLDDIKGLEARKSEAALSFAAGRIDLGMLEMVYSKLDPLLADARARSEKWAGMSDVVLQTAGAGAEERWNELALEQRREMVAALMEVVVRPVGRGHRTFDPTSIEIRWRSSGVR